MKINNINNWLSKPYFVVNFKGESFYYSTELEANNKYKQLTKKINMNKERENKRSLELNSLVDGGEKTYKEALLLVGSFALIILATIITILIK